MLGDESDEPLELLDDSLDDVGSPYYNNNAGEHSLGGTLDSEVHL